MHHCSISFETINGIGAFIIEIKILKVNKHYAFPLIVQKTKEGNLNSDIITEPILMKVDNIMLEDLIEFQKIEFQVIKGYVWNGKRDYKIQKVIQSIFEKRVEYKKEGNPLEQLYKLIMNSSYGKTIEKPTETEIKIIKNEDFDKYFQKNYNKIIEAIDMNDKFKLIKVRKQINNHFNFSLLGIQVLSMSKRIMNEVICLTYDIG